MQEDQQSLAVRTSHIMMSKPTVEAPMHSNLVTSAASEDESRVASPDDAGSDDYGLRSTMRSDVRSDVTAVVVKSSSVVAGDQELENNDGEFNLQPGVLYLGSESRRCAAGRSFPIDNDVRATSWNDAQFAPTMEAMKRLKVKHTTEPHTCKHCEQVVLDFQVSSVKSMSPRPFEGIQVHCAKSAEDVEAAKKDSCPFFTFIFKQPIQLTDLKSQENGLFLKIGGYSLGRYASEKLEQWQWSKQERRERTASLREKRRQYYLYYEGRPVPKDLTDEIPALRLCGHPESS